MSKPDLMGSTLKPSRGERNVRALRCPSLTVLFHVHDPDRAGEVARLVGLLDGKPCALSRIEPAFCPPGESGGEPLGDRYLSRTPAKLVSDGDGVRLESPGSSLRADGAPLSASRSWSRAELENGVVIEMAERVVLLLHLLGPPAPREPRFGMIGDSESMERIRAEVRNVAGLSAPVLLCGESGTGKELVARAIAGAGKRATRTFVAVNMAAVPASTAASELFGHEPGAFTGAARAHPGLFTQADGGTLFLDEIGTAPLDVQAMLLRAIETGEVQPLGSERPHSVDVRVMAATDEDLEAAMREGRFREALFHRLAGCRVELPALRQRRDDFGRLLMHFLRKELATAQRAPDVAWLAAPLVARLARYEWPGNVRELANVARRLVLASRGGKPLDEQVLPAEMIGGPRCEEVAAIPAPASSEIGEEALQSALRANRWKIGAAARALGISRTTLYSLIEASQSIRKAKDVPEQELRVCYAACGGDVDAMAEQLHVSSRGIRLRLKELGVQ